MSVTYVISRVDRIARTYAVTVTNPDGSPVTVSSVSVALLPVRGVPDASTVWTSVTYAAGSISLVLAGPDASPTGAVVVAGEGDLWMRVTHTAGVDAEKVERVTLMGGGSIGATVVATGPQGVQGIPGPQGVPGEVTLAQANALGSTDAMTPGIVRRGLDGAIGAANYYIAEATPPSSMHATPKSYVDTYGSQRLVLTNTNLNSTFNISLTTPALRAWTLTGNSGITGITATPAAGVAADFDFFIKQDVTGGRTFSWPSSGITWIGSSATAPVMPTAANAVMFVRLRWTGSEWLGLMAESNLAASTSSNLPNSIARRDSGGSIDFTNVGSMNAPGANHHLTRKDYVDATVDAAGGGFPPHTYNPVMAGIVAQAAMVANRTSYCRVVGGGPLLCSKIVLNIGVSSGNVAVAVYSNTGTGINATPGTRLAESGSVACPAASNAATVSLTSSVIIRPGMWIAISCDNTTATFSRVNGINHAGISGAWLRRTDGVFPPPSVPGTPGTDGSTWVMAGIE